MDDLHCCLAQIVHLCIEANLFLHQLDRFRSQLTNLDSMDRARLVEQIGIHDRFSIIIDELNAYHQNYFLTIYSNSWKYLSRPSFTVHECEETHDDLEEEFNHLNYFLRHRRKSDRAVFDQLHRLNILCVLSMQYQRFCAKIELADRFVHLRIDLLTNLERFNEELQNLLTEVNLHFQARNRAVRKANLRMTPKVGISSFYRTICLWSILAFVLGCYLLRPTDEATKLQSSWFL